MSPELEILDQPLGGDMPLSVIRQVCHQETDRRSHSIGMMLRDGVVELVDAGGESVPSWRWGELLNEESIWERGSGYYFKLTKKGAEIIS
jgi:hypothetical protein